MDAETKYNMASCLVVISIITCALSLIAIFMAYHIESCCCQDVNSVTVDILALLITILIGWNIYTVIDVKSEWRNLEKKIGEEKEKLKTYSDLNRNFSIGMFQLSNKDFALAVLSFMSSAIKANKIKEKKIINLCLNNIEIAITTSKDIVWESNLIEKYESMKDDFGEISNKRTSDIITRIEKTIDNH